MIGEIRDAASLDAAVKAALTDYYTKQGIDPEPIVGKVPEMEEE